jgi:hypothetical protein
MRFGDEGRRLLDGKRYYGAFPEEDVALPTTLVSHELLDALAALEKEFRQQIEQFRRGAVLSGEPAGSDKPDGSAKTVER